MNIYARLKDLFASKESQSRIVMSLNKVGQPVMTPANYEAFASKGFSKNAVVHIAINKICTACKGIEWDLYSRDKSGKPVEIEDMNHPLLKLWNKPNPMQDRASFIESLVGFENIAGNSYIEANNGNSDLRPNKNPPLELWPVRPDKMKIIPGATGYPAFYEFSYNGQSRKWPVDQVNLKSLIAHWKTFNPTNDWYGLSPLEAAMMQLDTNNSGNKWNLALLQNSSTPSGVLQMKISDANPRGELTTEQYGRLKSEFEEWHTGARNAGRPMIIEGGLSWQTIALSPKEMDFLKSGEMTATKLCLIFGVPPELVGLGQKTYSNYQEARLAFYLETILPTMDAIKGMINNWLSPQFGDNIYLDYDKDDIEALTVLREKKYTSLQPVTFLTINEKRAQVGYEEIEGGDALPAPSSPSFPNAGGGNGNQTGNDPQGSQTNQNAGAGNPNGTADNQGDGNQAASDLEIEQKEISGENENWKSINLLNANEKRRSWYRQNRRRKNLEGSFYRDLKSDYRDLTRRLSKQASALKGSDPKVIEFALIKEIDQFAPEFEKTLKRHIRYTLEDFGQMIFGEAKSVLKMKEFKANMKYESFTDDYIKRHTGTQIKSITSTNEKTIRRVIQEWTKETIDSGDSLPELSNFLEAEFEDLTPGSARRIARTEVSMASNNGSLQAVKSLQVPGIFKEWVTASDDRVRDGEHGYADHASVNGQEVSLDEKFNVPPDASMDGPGDPGSSADQVINCRCVLVYKQKGIGGE